MQAAFHFFLPIISITFMPKQNEKQENKKRKIKFPIARIKRIMQSDDDIGKVSTSAPVVLSKAIELFMRELLGEAIKVAKGTRLVMDDIREVVTKDSRFDFLKIIVEKPND